MPPFSTPCMFSIKGRVSQTSRLNLGYNHDKRTKLRKRTNIMTSSHGNCARQITVFGGSGFVGRHLVQRLAARGDVIRVAVRDPYAAQFLTTCGDVGQVVPVAVDIRDAVTVAAAVEGVDAVVNLVGILYESSHGVRANTFESLHHQGAANVAKAAAAAGVGALIQISAIGANKYSPATYARTKAKGEDAVHAAFADASVIRPSIIFGPEDSFFNLFASLMRITPVLPIIGCSLPRLEFPTPGKGIGLPRLNIYGNGGPRFQPVYVGDVAQAICVCLDSPQCRGETFELGGPDVRSFKELMELLLAQTGRRRFLAPVPFRLALMVAAFVELLPKPYLTRDQVNLLRRNNVVGRKARTFTALGITPTSMEIVLHTYLTRFCSGEAIRQARQS